jgi:hypothetical protein
MIGLLQPLRHRLSTKLVNLRASRRAYITSAHVRLRSCRSYFGWEGEGKWKKIRICRRRSRRDPRTPPSEIANAPPLAALLLALASFPLRRLGRKGRPRFRLCLDVASAAAPDFYMSPVRLRLFSNTWLIARNPPVPSPGGLRCLGQGVDPDPSEQTCHDFKPRNYYEMCTNSARIVSDLLRFVKRILPSLKTVKRSKVLLKYYWTT